jgi:undecaprenyl-diphosphatase
METLSFVGSGWFVTCVVAVPVVWLLRRGTRRAAVFLVATSVGGSLLNTIVKGAVGRARPVFADPIAIALGKSFPSGHAMGALVCYGAVLVAVLPFMRRGIRTPIVVATGALVATIGFSRVALGVHYLSDVIGGFVLGAAWLLGSVALFNVWRREASEER